VLRISGCRGDGSMLVHARLRFTPTDIGSRGPGEANHWRHLITWYVIAIIMLGVAITGDSKTFTESFSVGLLVCPTPLFVTPRSCDIDPGESYG